MDIVGKLHAKFDTQNVSDKFQKRDFVIEFADNPAYPQMVSFQLTQDRCPELDKFNVGDNLEVTFNLRGREWRTPDGEIKYFNTLEAWRIAKAENAASVSTPANKVDELSRMGLLPGEEDDTLPF